jgi:hypothetical protein
MKGRGVVRCADYGERCPNSLAIPRAGVMNLGRLEDGRESSIPLEVRYKNQSTLRFLIEECAIFKL